MTDIDPTAARRRELLRARGAEGADLEALLAYGTPHFDLSLTAADCPMPLADEPFVATWRQYAELARGSRVFDVLRERLVQLRFPIQQGISETEAYRAATRRGEPPPAGPGLELRHPETLELRIHPTPAGHLPILVAERADFITLVQALLNRNEPKPVPDSMGAVMVAGFNNWDRVRAHRAQWESDQGRACSEADWRLEFKRLISDRAAYQDKFIILSRGAYSSVAATALGLAEDAWQRDSLTIRLEHECTHYATWRLFGAMRNKLIDELIADYMGITAAAGHYRGDWFLRFVGLENYPAYRRGGRLENYLGEPPLSEAAFVILQGIVKDAVDNLQQFDATLSAVDRSPRGRAAALRLLAGCSVEQLAAPGAGAELSRGLARLA